MTYEQIERQLSRLEAKALLHGRTEAIEAEIQRLCRQLDEIEYGTGEQWLLEREDEMMDLDRKLGRAFKPIT